MGHRAELRPGVAIVLVAVEHAFGRCRRVGARGGEAPYPRGRLVQGGPAGLELGGSLADRRAWQGHQLELGRWQLQLEALITAGGGQHLLGAGSQVEGGGVEQHHLLLDPHGERRRRVEGRPQAFRGGNRFGVLANSTKWSCDRFGILA